MLVTGHCRGHVRFHSGIRGKDTVELHLQTEYSGTRRSRVATTQISYSDSVSIRWLRTQSVQKFKNLNLIFLNLRQKSIEKFFDRSIFDTFIPSSCSRTLQLFPLEQLSQSSILIDEENYSATKNALGHLSRLFILSDIYCYLYLYLLLCLDRKSVV